MHDTERLLRSRNRWRGIALALILSHAVAFVAWCVELNRHRAQLEAAAYAIAIADKKVQLVEAVSAVTQEQLKLLLSKKMDGESR